MLLPQRIKGHKLQLAFVYYYIWSRIMTSSQHRQGEEQHLIHQHVHCHGLLGSRQQVLQELQVLQVFPLICGLESGLSDPPG